MNQFLCHLSYFLFINSPANSRVSSSNVSRQSTQEYVDSSFDTYEAEHPNLEMTSPARTRWIEAFNRVCAELSEVSQLYIIAGFCCIF